MAIRPPPPTGVGTGVGVHVGVGARVGVTDVCVGVGVAVAVGVTVGAAVGVALGVTDVCVGVGAAVGVAVGKGVRAHATSARATLVQNIQRTINDPLGTVPYPVYGSRLADLAVRSEQYTLLEGDRQIPDLWQNRDLPIPSEQYK